MRSNITGFLFVHFLRFVTLLIFLENWVFAFSELGFSIFRTEFLENNCVLTKFVKFGFKNQSKSTKPAYAHIFVQIKLKI